MFGLAIHGGAGTLPRAEMAGEMELKYRAGLSAALEAGYAVLQAHGTSLDAVTRAIVSLLCSGTFSRCSDVRWIFSHGGGALPMVVDRIVRQTARRATLGARGGAHAHRAAAVNRNTAV